ncbi:hypothetical protein [Stomatobaculum longum]|uniref:hypothetical protein n=1 Tax=Stomatobaculum longum TaxID=796942 RepID=UPI002804F762|nr:hypothetical protein [Stomatobaculum longum]
MKQVSFCSFLICSCRSLSFSSSTAVATASITRTSQNEKVTSTGKKETDLLSHPIFIGETAVVTVSDVSL